MPKSASERRKSELGEVQLNLNPMMDLFAVLIPTLLMMSVVVEVSAVNVSAPAIGPSDAAEVPKEDKPPLNYTVTITENGYILSALGQPLPNDQGEPGTPQRPTIPVIERPTSCGRYRGTVPPPRAKNRDRSICDPARPTDTKSFWIYDVHALTRRTTELKDAYPDERRVIIAGSANVDFEPISDAMDATRDVDEKGTVRALFDEVIISPGN
jgi:biopolymer transport protein ExbD